MGVSCEIGGRTCPLKYGRGVNDGLPYDDNLKGGAPYTDQATNMLIGLSDLRSAPGSQARVVSLSWICQIYHWSLHHNHVLTC